MSMKSWYGFLADFQSVWATEMDPEVIYLTSELK